MRLKSGSITFFDWFLMLFKLILCLSWGLRRGEIAKMSPRCVHGPLMTAYDALRTSLEGFGGAKMAISAVLKSARAYAQNTGFFYFAARMLCLKLLAAK